MPTTIKNLFQNIRYPFLGCSGALLRESQVSHYDVVYKRHDEQDHQPARFSARYYDLIPYKKHDKDIDQRDKHQKQPPESYFTDTAHQEDLDNRDPRQPGMVSLCLFGDKIQAERKINIYYNKDCEEYSK